MVDLDKNIEMNEVGGTIELYGYLPTCTCMTSCMDTYSTMYYEEHVQDTICYTCSSEVTIKTPLYLL